MHLVFKNPFCLFFTEMQGLGKRIKADFITEIFINKVFYYNSSDKSDSYSAIAAHSANSLDLPPAA